MGKCFNRLVKYGRDEKKRGTSKLSLNGCPQKKGTCVRVFTANPRKPNSAMRKLARVRLSSGIVVNAYIPGIGHKLQEHSSVLVRKGKVKDLPGVKFVIIRGVGDCDAVQGRKTSRSKYGASKAK